MDGQIRAVVGRIHALVVVGQGSGGLPAAEVRCCAGRLCRRHPGPAWVGSDRLTDKALLCLDLVGCRRTLSAVVRFLAGVRCGVHARGGARAFSVVAAGLWLPGMCLELLLPSVGDILVWLRVRQGRLW